MGCKRLHLLKWFPCRKPFIDPGASAPESVNISGPSDFSTIFPIALKKANSMWKGPGIEKRSSYLGASVICRLCWLCCIEVICNNVISLANFFSTALCGNESVLDDIKTGNGQIKKVHIQNNLLW